MMVVGSLVPAFFVVVGAPMIAGRSLEASGQFVKKRRPRSARSRSWPG